MPSVKLSLGRYGTHPSVPVSDLGQHGVVPVWRATERSPYQFLQPKRSICQVERMEHVAMCLWSVR